MTASVEDKVLALEKLADDNGWSFRDDYSGRGMSGKTCAGITVEFGDEVTQCIEEAAIIGVRGAVTDSMGRGTIVYWPSLKTGNV